MQTKYTSLRFKRMFIFLMWTVKNLYFVKVDFQNWDFLQSKIPILNKNRFGLLTQKLNKSVQNPIWIFNFRIIDKCNQCAWNIQTCLKVKRRVMKYLSHTTSHIGCDIWWEKNFIFYVRGPALKARRQTFQDVYNPSTLTKTAFVFFTMLTQRKNGNSANGQKSKWALGRCHSVF